MTDDDHQRDKEARRLLESAFLTPEEKAQADEEHKRQLHRLEVISAVSAWIGWDLDYCSAARAITVAGLLDAAWAETPGGLERREKAIEIFEWTRALDRTDYFAELESAWRRGREVAAEGVAEGGAG